MTEVEQSLSTYCDSNNLPLLFINTSSNDQQQHNNEVVEDNDILDELLFNILDLLRGRYNQAPLLSSGLQIELPTNIFNSENTVIKVN